MKRTQKPDAWLALIRLPNIFTVPGDVIVGYIIGESTLENAGILLGFSVPSNKFLTFTALYAVAAVLCIYIFGLVTNDIADVDEDRKERPYRPLASGAISIPKAWILSAILLAAGLISAKFAGTNVFYTVLLLSACVISYNFFLKKYPVTGVLLLAFCRALALFTGYYAAGQSAPYSFMMNSAAVLWILYFTILSAIAYNETSQHSFGPEKYLLPLLPFLWLISIPAGSEALPVVLILRELPPAVLLSLILLLGFSAVTFRVFLILNSARPDPAVIQKSVGILIRNVVLLQASVCAIMGYPYTAAALLILYTATALTAKRFYSS